MDQKNIRNFCIIAHIDHGKSTLADRFLELTDTISDREKKDQILDSMDLERERGITIKMQPVTMRHGQYTLNLIDTPGHVDFSYEVSRALAAVEGAILLVDASQGIQAQTLANLYLALEQNLTIIPVINKIDLKVADVDGTKAELLSLLGCGSQDIIAVSAKTGQNVEQVLRAVVERVPAPTIDHASRALIFDSYYDKHFGVVCDIRVFGGVFKIGDEINFYQTGISSNVKEVGIYIPKQYSVEVLSTGQIGYLVTGIREPSKCQVGDTVVNVKCTNIKPLHGYKQVKPMVFANIYLKDQSKYLELKKALEELKLNDSSLYFETVAARQA
ncbi:MAG: GTP-binding protein, partial [Candidatus Jacksonbacteria bacterium]